MSRLLLTLLVVVVIAGSCGSDDDSDSGAASTCLPGDPNCEDVGGDNVAQLIPDGIDLVEEGPISINFGGFFHSDGELTQLCSSLAESFPPQCGVSIIEIVGPLDVILEHVAESFGDPDTAPIRTEQGITWTDEWANVPGILEAGKLFVDS